LSASRLSAQPVPVDDPNAYAVDIMETLANKGGQDAAAKIAQTLGQPRALGALQAAFHKLAGRQFDVVGKVVDTSYGRAMRQIAYYTYVRGAGFLYFRFNFKRTGAGLVLANFAFKDETNELFPKDFGIVSDEQGR